MEKVKVEIPAALYEEWAEVAYINGQKIYMRKHISYAEMVRFANEYAQFVCVIDEESQVAYETMESKKYEDYLVLKYYSNVDVDAAENPIDYAAELMPLIQSQGSNYFFSADFNICQACDLAHGFAYDAIRIYEKYHSIGTRIGKAFAGLLDNGDIIKELAQSRGLSEQMIDFLQEKENIFSGLAVLTK